MIKQRPALVCALLLIYFCFFEVRDAQAGCLSSLPYGYNGYFVHLPKNEAFCVDTPNGAVFYKTDQFGARVFKTDSQNVAVHAFGESQLIEIFPRHGSNSHVLSKLYGNSDLHLYGAPNNGPNETISFIEYIQKNNPNAPKNITIGVNLGFDLFRIIPEWKPSEKVSYRSKDIDFMIKYPKIFEIINFGKAVFGDSFEFIDRPKQIEKARDHFNKNINNINIYYTVWLKNIQKLKEKYNLIIDVLFFDSYWSYDQYKKTKNSLSNEDISQKLKSIICSNKNIYSSFNDIYFLHYPKTEKTETLFTYTGRHFNSYPINFQKIENYCSES